MKFKVIFFLLFLLASSSFAAKRKQPSVVVMDLRTERLVNPMSINTSSPRLGWRIESNKSDVMQTSYHILVASSEEKLDNNNGDMWDTTVNSDRSQWITYEGRQPRSNTRCYWKVRIVTTQGESDWSAPAMWNVGLLSESDWQGQWIGFDQSMPWDVEGVHSRLSARYLRTEFNTEKAVKCATLYICGLGLYEVFINGKRIGNQVLAPVPTDYRCTVLYNAFDVTSMLLHKNAQAQHSHTARTRGTVFHRNHRQQTTRAGFPASMWETRLRMPQRRAKPPCWPVSGLTERPPMPSQVLVQGAQWLVNGEGIG